MIPTAIKAAALLGLMVVASADRALLQQSGGNSLHGVAVAFDNFYITNNNGTWTRPTLYNADSSAYGAQNSAFKTANAATGAFALVTTNPAVTSPAAGIFTEGVTSVAFPSKSLGVMVGPAGGLVAGTAAQPSILISVDAGLTWMAVTGTPSVTPQITVTTAGTPTGAVAYPSVGPGDLASVYMVSKSVGYAVGSTALAGASYSTPATGYAVILMTSNGGSVWKNVLPPPYTQAQSAAVTAANSPLTGTFFGDLYSVSADAAGKNVFAVGAPSFVGTVTSGSPNTFASTAAVVPTILYSGNAGASWTAQTAPVAAGGAYTLFGVAVVKGTTAYAVGGRMSSAAAVSVSGTALAAATNGQIIYTTNGGFSWTQAQFPGNSGGRAPGFTCVAVNGPTVWVGGFVRQNQHYPLSPVLGYVTVTGGTPSTVSTGQTPVNGQSYGILVSTNGRNFVGAAATSTFPPGFVFSQATEPDVNAATTNLNFAYTFKDVTGITWDNSVHGWIYGNGFIIATADGGKTWAYESPAALIAAAAAQTSYAGGLIWSIANVPTSY